MKNLERFMGKAITELVANKVEVRLEPKEKVVFDKNDHIGCGGFFNEDPLVLSVGIGKPVERWAPIFIHEYCHFRQWVEKEPKYIALYRDDKPDIDEVVNEWLEGQRRVRKRDITKYINMIRRMELNCEKRAVKLIRRHRIGINLKDYIRDANAYMYFHSVMLQQKSWYKISPLLIKELVAMMPDHFLQSYTRVPKKVEELMIERCF